MWDVGSSSLTRDQALARRVGLEEIRRHVVQLFGGRAFQAEKTASANALRQREPGVFEKDQ